MMFDTLQALGSLDEVIVATTSSRLPMTRSSPTGQKKKFSSIRLVNQNSS